LNQQTSPFINSNADPAGVHLDCSNEPRHSVSLGKVLVNDCALKQVEARGDHRLLEAVSDHDASHYGSTCGGTRNNPVAAEQILQFGFYLGPNVAVGESRLYTATDPDGGCLPQRPKEVRIVSLAAVSSVQDDD
jgi:hypothetical protein